MSMIWLMTVQEPGRLGMVVPGLPSGIEFDLTPRWMAFDNPDVDDKPPNPNRFDTLHRWPQVVEIRRPDGTIVKARPWPCTVHLNLPYELRMERDEFGRTRDPWICQMILMDVNVEEVPPGSEIWGEVNDEDLRSPEEPRHPRDAQ